MFGKKTPNFKASVIFQSFVRPNQQKEEEEEENTAPVKSRETVTNL
jgi:hypothetical protein